MDNNELSTNLAEVGTDAISRQVLLDKFEPWLKVKDYNDGELNMLKAILYEIRFMRSAQPEIIRCRECKFASGDSRICMKFDHSPIGELDFCSFAERREVNNMSIEQEKMIVEALPSLYPLQEFEERAIDTVLNAIPKWIPVTERLPESKEEDLEYPTVLIAFENEEIMLGCFYESTKEWGTGEYFDKKCDPIAWMPLPEPYKGVNV